MLRMTLRVHPVGQPAREVVVKPVTQVAFERHFGVGLASLADDLKIEYIYWLAWDSLRKLGEKPPEFDPWLESVESVESVDEDDDDPKVTAPSV